MQDALRMETATIDAFCCQVEWDLHEEVDRIANEVLDWSAYLGTGSCGPHLSFLGPIFMVA